MLQWCSSSPLSQRHLSSRMARDQGCGVFHLPAPCREFPPQAQDYEILDDCGRGVSATVSTQTDKSAYSPRKEPTLLTQVRRELSTSAGAPCALQAAQRGRGHQEDEPGQPQLQPGEIREARAAQSSLVTSAPCSSRTLTRSCLWLLTQEEIIHEAQTMKNYHHPNVLPLWCSFVHGSDLWMVMPFISGGSVLHVMKYAHPDGLDEVVIATIMRDVLRALEYVHKQGGIHRDVKVRLQREMHTHTHTALQPAEASSSLAGSVGTLQRYHSQVWHEKHKSGGSRQQALLVSNTLARTCLCVCAHASVRYCMLSSASLTCLCSLCVCVCVFRLVTFSWTRTVTCSWLTSVWQRTQSAQGPGGTRQSCARPSWAPRAGELHTCGQ